MVTPSSRKAYRANKRLADMADFAAWMVLEVHRCFARVVRVHTGGDFYNLAYTRKWIEIVRRCPRTVFYAYTRSWRDPKILPALKVLAREPNVVLWFSCDRETDRPPAVPRVQTAWMAEHDEDVAPYPVDLVFRDEQRTVMRRDAAGNLVCRYDTKVRPKPTCSQCRHCFARKRWRTPSKAARSRGTASWSRRAFSAAK